MNHFISEVPLPANGRVNDSPTIHIDALLAQLLASIVRTDCKPCMTPILQRPSKVERRGQDGN